MNRALFRVALTLAMLLSAGQLAGQMSNFGKVIYHGIPSPTSHARAVVATSDEGKRELVLCWLYDHRGGYALLLIDARTGETETFPTPHPWAGDAPYASLLSTQNKFYTLFG